MKTLINVNASSIAGNLIINELKQGKNHPYKYIVDKDINGKIAIFVESNASDCQVGVISKKNSEEIKEEIADAFNKSMNISVSGITLENESGKDTLYAEIEIKKPVEKTKTKVEEEKAVDASEEAVIAFLRDEHKIPTSMINEIIKIRRDNIKKYGLMPTPKTLYRNPFPNRKTSQFAECLINPLMTLKTGQQFAVIFEGDKSLGKNVACETIAYYVFNLPLYLTTFSQSMTTEDIYATKMTDNSAAEALSQSLAESFIAYQNGDEKEFVDAAKFELLKAQSAAVKIKSFLSPFSEALLNGGVFVANEMNCAVANFLTGVLNAVLDNTGFINIPGYGKIETSKNFVFIATQNAEYTGTNVQNEATISRMGCVEFQYPDSIKGQLQEATKGSGLTDQPFKEVDNFYRAVHEAIKNGAIENQALNIRGYVRALKAFAMFPDVKTLREQIQLQVINTCNMDDRLTLDVMLEENVFC